MPGVRIEGLSKSYGPVEVLKDIDLEIADSEFVVFVGPSGCGKSTLLRMIAGLEPVDSGRILFGEREVTKVAPARRDVAMVFQSYALYPHMSVADNMTMSLRLARVPKLERRRRAEEVASMLQLSALLDRKPGELSGGQRQRVAIGRAIVRRPDIYLFDEPLSNLDAALRIETRVGISQLHADLNKTMIYVTHDQVEAMTMADRIVIMDSGKVAQVGAPMDLYNDPVNLFVAGFLGSPKMNFLPVSETAREVDKIRLSLPGSQSISLDFAPAREAAATTLGVRPEHIKIGETGNLEGIVKLVEHLGSETLVYLEAPAGPVIAKTGQSTPARINDRVRFGFEPHSVHLFDADATSIKSRHRSDSGTMTDGKRPQSWRPQNGG